MSAAMALLGACGVDAALDCHAICDRYRTCFENSYDVGACETRCRSNSANSADYRRQANTCDACIDARSCAASTFNCVGPCASVVP